MLEKREIFSILSHKKFMNCLCVCECIIDVVFLPIILLYYHQYGWNEKGKEGIFLDFWYQWCLVIFGLSWKDLEKSIFVMHKDLISLYYLTQQVFVISINWIDIGWIRYSYDCFKDAGSNFNFYKFVKFLSNKTKSN